MTRSEKTPSEAYGDEYESWDNDERNEQIFRDGNPAPRFEEQFPDNDGAFGTWLTTKAPLFDATGAASQVVTISLDITDRKDAENQAAKAHERLVDALESVPRAFALFDADDCLVMCNRKAALTYVTPRANTGNLILKRNLARDLPLLRADESKIKQILLNLLSNAVKFTPPGGTVRVRAGRHSDGGVELSVRDDGIGVAAENQALVFEPFRHVDSTLSRRFDGTGLGLPLAKQMVELHDGTLRFERNLGVGTTVTLIFPADRVIDLADTAQ